MAGWWLKNNLEKYEFVNGKDDIPHMKWKKTCSKPPMSIYIYILLVFGYSIRGIYKKDISYNIYIYIYDI